MEFFKLKTPNEVIKILDQISHPLPSETVDISEAYGRTLSEDIVSPVDMPGFMRSSMDGYALRAKDTFGASQNSPAYLKLIGQVNVGELASMKITEGTAVKVYTGSMIPEGSDAVLMLEYVEELDDETIEIVKPVAPGENIVKKDEDISKGQTILKKGHALRPQEIGALAGMGILSVKVVRRPRVAIISSGDEIIPPDQVPKEGQIRDINSYSLAGLTMKFGGVPINMGIVPDDYELLRDKLISAINIADIALISGGSSVGSRDKTLDAIKSLPSADVLVHGIAIRPGKPTIIAKAMDKFVFGLPGNPVSVMVTFQLFVGYLIKSLLGVTDKLPFHIKAILTRNVASAPGREDYICVRLKKVDETTYAEPIIGKSALISIMVKADGLIRIPLNTEGLEANSEVEVFPFL